jgi:hypothetical protein
MVCCLWFCKCNRLAINRQFECQATTNHKLQTTNSLIVSFNILIEGQLQLIPQTLIGGILKYI